MIATTSSYSLKIHKIGCSIAPLTDHINNHIYQELIDEENYDGNKSEERIYLDLRASSGYTNEAEKLE